MAQGEAMDARRGVLGKLPLEVMERALSFLSVPELCRMRAVCKAWNEVISRPSFHDLCDVNGGNDEYLFMWSEDFRWEPRRVVVNPLFSDTLSFLDVEARRWYSIPAADLLRVCGCGHDVESRFMAMNHGLVCELTTGKGCRDNKFDLTICDPVAKTRRVLPTPPQVSVAPDIQLVSALIVTAVDDVSRSYKVFLLNNLSHTVALRAQPRMYVHEPYTDEWRAVRVTSGVQEEQEDHWAEHAVVTQGSLFVLKQHNDSDFDYRLSLFRYKIQEETWAQVYHMYFPQHIESTCQLVASRNRLFLNVWLGPDRSLDPTVNPRASDPGLKSDPDCPNDYPGACFEDPDYSHTITCFEMYEVLIDDYRRKPVVRLTRAQLQQIFGSDGSDRERFESDLVDLTHSFPCLDSDGICSSVILVKATAKRFQLVRYHLVTGSVDLLPIHPSVLLSEKSIGEYFNVENMKLSLRNLLAQRPKKQTPSGCGLLQGGRDDHC